jgi:hypothetical protein
MDVTSWSSLSAADGSVPRYNIDFISVGEALKLIPPFNPSTYGDLIPTSYCDVRRFPAGYLNLELNFAGVYAN